MDDTRKDPLARMAGPEQNDGTITGAQDDAAKTPQESSTKTEVNELKERVNELIARNEELRARNKQLTAKLENTAAANEKPKEDPGRDQSAAARLTEKLAERDEQIRTLLVRNAVASSRFIQEKTVLPPGVALDVFSNIFTVEERNGTPVPVAHTPSGEPIMSRTDPGQPAKPDEAIEIYILHHFPERDAILKGGKSGSGAGGNQESGATPRAVPRNDSRAFSRHLEAIAAGKVDVI